MNTKTLDKLRDARLFAEAVSNRLYRLAEAYELTGNDNVSSKLCNLAADARHCASLVQEGTNEALSSALIATEQATVNMLMAAVAVADAR